MRVTIRCDGCILTLVVRYLEPFHTSARALRTVVAQGAISSLRSRAMLLLSNTNVPRQPWALPLASHAAVSAHIRGTLAAALSGWIDLRALFSPSKHALRADHDE